MNKRKEIEEIPEPTFGNLSDIQKAIRATSWIIIISWIFGFTAFSLYTKNNELAFSISMLIFSALPAITTIVINKKEGGDWQSLQFVKPQRKAALLAFVAPIIYFLLILGTQYIFNVRTLPNFNKLGSAAEVLLTLVLGYPFMIILIMGEEIAWRGYLQEKLINSFGGLKGLIILGLIWGVWHLPISLQGYNLPENPILETLVTTPLMCVALALMIGYFGFNSKSIFIGLLLHTSNNHLGGTFLYLTEAKDEFTHAMIFCIFYILIILIFSFLYKKKEENLHQNL